jgi:hypothetical protein
MLEFIIILVVLAAGYYFYKENKRKSIPEAVPVSTLPFPCVIEGTIDAPPMEDRVKALAIEAASKGIVITGEYKADVAAQGGEMMLIGYSFKFVFDTNGQIIKNDSHANLFGVNYPVEGGMNPDGTLGMDVVVDTARVQVQGKIENGKFVNGKVVKTWLPHIFGILNGAYHRV